MRRSTTDSIRLRPLLRTVQSVLIKIETQHPCRAPRKCAGRVVMRSSLYFCGLRWRSTDFFPQTFGRKKAAISRILHTESLSKLPRRWQELARTIKRTGKARLPLWVSFERSSIVFVQTIYLTFPHPLILAASLKSVNRYSNYALIAVIASFEPRHSCIYRFCVP